MDSDDSHCHVLGCWSCTKLEMWLMFEVITFLLCFVRQWHQLLAISFMVRMWILQGRWPATSSIINLYMSPTTYLYVHQSKIHCLLSSHSLSTFLLTSLKFLHPHLPIQLRERDWSTFWSPLFNLVVNMAQISWNPAINCTVSWIKDEQFYEMSCECEEHVG